MRVPIYGSGGFTSYTDAAAAHSSPTGSQQRHPDGEDEDRTRTGPGPGRVGAARKAIGPDARLFVDANGAYRPARQSPWPTRSPSATCAGSRSRSPPRTSKVCATCASGRRRDGRRGRRVRLRPALLRAHAGRRRRRRPAGRRHALRRDHRACCASMPCAARARGRCRCTARPRSTPTPGVALETIVHLEYFHDHVRIEDMLFEGVPPRQSERCGRMSDGLAWVWSFAGATPSVTRRERPMQCRTDTESWRFERQT